MDFSSIFKYINKAASSLNQRGNDQQNQQNQQNDEAKKALLVLQKLASRLAGPTLFTGLGIFIFIVIIVFFFFQDTDVGKALTGSSEDSPPSQEGGTNPTTPSVPSIPGLTIIVTAQESVQNGQDIEYKVEIRYDPATATTPIERIELYDTLPPGVVFAGTSGNKGINSTDKEITWPLSDPANSGGFTFMLHPYLEDVIIINSVFARIIGGSSGSGGTSPSGELGALVAGQGRNTMPLGDRRSFISTILSRAGGLSLVDKEAYLEQIFDAGQQYRVNPIMLLNIWGTENGFRTDFEHYFGCAVYAPNPPVGFAEGLDCAADALDSLMSQFEKGSTGGSLEIPSTTGNTCIYTDAFDYAYEYYAPVCHSNDGNEPAHVNFISFYKKFMGLN